MRFARAVVFFTVVLAPVLAHAQSNYPNRPIRLITPAAPGGTTVIGLRHGPHELAGDAEQHVGGEVEVGVAQVLRDPGGQLVALVVPLVALVW